METDLTPEAIAELRKVVTRHAAMPGCITTDEWYLMLDHLPALLVAVEERNAWLNWFEREVGIEGDYVDGRDSTAYLRAMDDHWRKLRGACDRLRSEIAAAAEPEPFKREGWTRDETTNGKAFEREGWTLDETCACEAYDLDGCPGAFIIKYGALWYGYCGRLCNDPFSTPLDAALWVEARAMPPEPEPFEREGWARSQGPGPETYDLDGYARGDAYAVRHDDGWEGRCHEDCSPLFDTAIDAALWVEARARRSPEPFKREGWTRDGQCFNRESYDFAGPAYGTAFISKCHDGWRGRWRYDDSPPFRTALDAALWVESKASRREPSDG